MALNSFERGERIRERLARRGSKKCAIEFCHHERHELSRWCRSHADRERRHGAPLQRCIRVAELKPYANGVKTFLKTNVGHPALSLVFAELDKLLSDATLIPVTHRPRSRDWRTRLRIDLARLHGDGVTGEEIFLRAAALHLFATAQPRSLQPHSRPFWFQASRLILNARLRVHTCHSLFSRQVGARLPAASLEHLGRTVTSLCWPVFTAMVSALEAAAVAPKTHHARITEALASQPFAPSSQPTINDQGISPHAQ